MKMIKVQRERTGRVIPVWHDDIVSDDGRYAHYTYVPEYGPGWQVKLRGRNVGWRATWEEAMRVAQNFCEEYYAEPVPLFTPGV